METKLPPVPHASKLTEAAGFLTQVWADWFNKAQRRLSGDFASTQASTAGYQQLPSGLYLQWGITASLGSATTTTITFPINFPTACFQVWSGIRNNSAAATSETGQWGTGGYATSGFDLHNRTSAAYVFNWMAVGN